MSKQVPAAEPQADKSNKSKLEPVVSSELTNDLTGLTGASGDLPEFRKLVDLSYEEIKEVAIKLNPNLLDEEKIFASFDAQKAVEEILAAQKTF